MSAASQDPSKMHQDDGVTLPPLADDAQAVADSSNNPAVVAPVFSATPAPVDPQTLQQTIVAMPDEAQDTDLIEKEWVEKAKQIVAHMSDDPFEQQQELSKMKADYMKKRYGRDIKLSEGS